MLVILLTFHFLALIRSLIVEGVLIQTIAALFFLLIIFSKIVFLRILRSGLWFCFNNRSGLCLVLIRVILSLYFYLRLADLIFLSIGSSKQSYFPTKSWSFHPSLHLHPSDGLFSKFKSYNICFVANIISMIFMFPSILPINFHSVNIFAIITLLFEIM